MTPESVRNVCERIMSMRHAWYCRRRIDLERGFDTWGSTGTNIPARPCNCRKGRIWQRVTNEYPPL